MRELVSKQLYSGHIRLDLGNPMTKGNLIVFKGPSSAGKTELAYTTINQFLQEDESHRAIYVGLTQNSGASMLEQLSENCQSRAICLGVDTLNKSMTVSDAEYILAPQVGLKLAQSCEKVLLVFDDVLLHQMKEQHVYALADQPFSNTQVINHLMDNTGIFKDGREVTSIVIVDTGSNTLHFQKEEDELLVHINSLADQVIDFSDDM
jgi:F0F1-type ATP synthase alpha subunit